MPHSVADSRTIFSENDSVGGWDEATTSYYDGAEFGGRSGNGFVGYDIDIETLHNFETGITIPSDITGVHYGQWIRVTNSGALDTKANGGIRLCLRDSSGNESYFFVGGIDTYGGGWYYFVADMSGTPDANNGTNAVITDAVDFGVGGKFLAKSADDNFQMDLGHYGTGGLTITGTPDTGTYGNGKSLEEVYDIINAANYGGIAKQAGSYVIKLPLIIDAETFNDENSIAFFEDFPVSNTFHKVSLGTTTQNNITFNGLITKTEGDTKTEFDFSAAVNSLVYDDSTSLNNGLMTFKSGTYSGNKFVGCAGIQANAGATLDGFSSNLSGLITLTTTAVLKNSAVYKSTAVKAVVCEDLARVDNNYFTSDGTGHAVDIGTISSNASMTWNNKESGYASSNGSTGNETILVSVDSGITLTINVADGASTPSYYNTGAGTVNVVSGQVTLTLTGLPDGIEVRIRQGSHTIQHTQNVSGGQETYQYTYVQDELVTISFTGAGIIQAKTLKMLLGNTDQTSLVTFANDPSYQEEQNISCYFSGVTDITDTLAHTITMTFTKEPKASTMTIANITQQVEDNGTISDIGVTGNPLVWEFDFTADADVTDTTNYYRAGTGITDLLDNALAANEDSSNFEISNVVGTNYITNGEFTTDTDWIHNPGMTIADGHLNANTDDTQASANVVSMQAKSGIYTFYYEIISYTRGAPAIHIVGADSGVLDLVDLSVGTHSIEYDVTNNSDLYFYIYGGASGVGGEWSMDNVSFVGP